MLRIVVLGLMGRFPFAGQTWLYLNWLLGLSALGHEVWYVEDDSVWPYDPERNAVVDDSSYAIRHIKESMERVGLADRWAYRRPERTGVCAGMSRAQLDQLYRDCDLLLNVVGGVMLRNVQMAATRRIYVECDPVTAELEMASGRARTVTHFSAHTDFVTYGENYGARDCGVPLPDLTFLKTRQPIDLQWWPFDYRPDARYFTTIGNYRQDGNDVEFNGEVYRWSKHHEWDKFIRLPLMTPQQFELCLQIEGQPRDAERLRQLGWRLTPALPMSLDVFGAYPAYIRASRGEFTVAKDQNVRLRSGWFSERDACYLASGKPVVTQDTGFGCVLPVGEGLFAVSSVEDAAAAIDAINSNYPLHAKAARAIAEEYFDARRVAAQLMQDLGA